MANLSGKRVAILATDGFEQSELFEPKRALEAAGATVEIVSLQRGEIKGWDEDNWGQSIGVDALVQDVNAAEFDALMLPGGVINPDKLRVNEDALTFVRGFFERGLPVGAICHGPWTLINAGVADGRRMTSYGSIRRDLENAGVDWSDEEVVCEQGLVTSRTPADLPAFCDKLIEEIAEGVHAGQTA
ncbi:MAG TPA: type 1 glutamine amidotransferase domain-containing protein [Abditibacterium sp.]|jgi:protease I